MKGDFTRVTFDRKKHYTGVLKQQGRVDLDADWNEYVEMQAYLDQTELQDVIGPCGVPKSGGGFEIGATTNGELTISPGHFYVNGILCELDAATNYSEQPDYPATALTPADKRTDLVYLDVWQRHITAIEDPEIREKALGGPDTATRVQTVWQVKVLEGEAEASYACTGAFPGWKKATAGSQARLSTQVGTTGTASPDDLCLIATSDGYRGLENRLYRVEIHQGGSPGSTPDPTFKWSRDNGSVTFAIKSFDKDNPRKIKVEQLGRDQVLTLHENDWVEILGDETELDDEQTGTLARVAGIDRTTLELTLDRNVSAHKNEGHPKVRRWDQIESSTITLEDGAVPVQEGAWIELEQGVQIRFKAGGAYRSGEYWVFAARVPSGTVPRGEVESLEEALPRGIKHHYCKLALVTWERAGGRRWKATIEDCRPEFPPLTNICAEDVCYDNSNTPELGDVSDVQAAIEALYLYQKDGCTVSVLPVPGWESALDIIGEGHDAHICFQAGDYPLDTRVTLRDKGHIKITGFGPGTHIVARNDEAALVFEDCPSVTIRDLYAESRRASSPAAEPSGIGGLSGVLTFRSCGNLNIESVALRCASGAERAAACISVFNNTSAQLGQSSHGSIRIRHCDLRIGHQQVGILLTDAVRARIEDNMLRVGKKPRGLTLRRLLQNRQYRGAVLNLLIHDVQLNPQSPTNLAPDQVLVRVNRHSVLFRTDRNLVNDWNRLLAAHTPWGVQSHRQLYLHLRKVAIAILLNAGTYPGGSSISLPAFKAWYKRLSSSNMAAAAQGIVLGGTTGRDIQLHRNTIFGAQQGIHLGLSSPPYAKPTAPNKLGTVVVADNNIGVFLSPAADERHGVFVGNCDSLIVKDNYVQVHRFPVTKFLPVDGIRVYGYLGWMMVIGQNHLVNCTTGVKVQPLGSIARSYQWLVADNAMPSAAQPVIAPASVQKRNNIW